jgi:WhiB family transcriptional regulator, redox-sensing transcriptional regulator
MGSAAPDLSWRPQGACHDLDPQTFYPSRGESIRPAVAVCEACPVRAECLEWALHHENFGIWGGQSERARRTMRRNRGIRLALPQLATYGAECGTPGGAQGHYHRGEPICAPCRAAKNLYQAERKSIQRAKVLA